MHKVEGMCIRRWRVYTVFTRLEAGGGGASIY